MGVGINMNMNIGIGGAVGGIGGGIGMSAGMGLMNPMQMLMQLMQGVTGGGCCPCQNGMDMAGMGMPGMGMSGMGMPCMMGGGMPMTGFSPMMGNNIGNFLGMQQNPMMQMMQMMMQMMQMMMMGGGANPFMGGMMPDMMGGMPGMGGGFPGMGGGNYAGAYAGPGGAGAYAGGYGGGAGAFAGPGGAEAFAGTGGAPLTGNGSGMDAVNMARRFLGRSSRSIKGELPHFTAAGGNTNNCADFVSSCLESQGLLRGHHVGVSNGGLQRALLQQGYRVIPASQARAGDVWISNSGGHTELVQGVVNGRLSTIGSNNVRTGYQMITERTKSFNSGVIYARR